MRKLIYPALMVLLAGCVSSGKYKTAVAHGEQLSSEVSALKASHTSTVQKAAATGKTLSGQLIEAKGKLAVTEKMLKEAASKLEEAEKKLEEGRNKLKKNVERVRKAVSDLEKSFD